MFEKINKYGMLFYAGLLTLAEAHVSVHNHLEVQIRNVYYGDPYIFLMFPFWQEID